MSKKEFDITISVKEAAWVDVLAKSYKIALWDEFVWNKKPKEHSLLTHIDWFITQLKLNTTELNKIPLAKFQIYLVNYNIGTGSEIMANRPSIIYKKSEYTKGDDVIVIPLTSAVQDKLKDSFDVFVPKDWHNKLFQNSYARLRQMRCVSLKKVGGLLGTITDEKVQKEIDKAMKEMLWIE